MSVENERRNSVLRAPSLTQLRQENALLGKALEELQARYDALSVEHESVLNQLGEMRAQMQVERRAEGNTSRLRAELDDLRERFAIVQRQTEARDSAADIMGSLQGERSSYWRKRCLDATARVADLEQLCAAQRNENALTEALYAERRAEAQEWCPDQSSREIWDELQVLRKQVQDISAEARASHERVAVLEELRVEDYREWVKYEEAVFKSLPSEKKGETTARPAHEAQTPPPVSPQRAVLRSLANVREANKIPVRECRSGLRGV